MPGDASPRTCLVLGGHGFVGSAFVARASAQGYRAIPVGRDDWRAHVGDEVDLLVCAAGSAKKRLADADPAADHEGSVAIVDRALDEFRAGRFVLLSTVDVYPEPGVRSRTNEATPIDPESLATYGRHRRLAELAVESRHDHWLVLRLAQMVGPGLRKGPLFDVLHGAPRWVAPESSHHYLSTDAVARLALQMLDRGVRRETVNLVGRGNVEVRTLISSMPEGRRDRPEAADVLERYDIDTTKAESMVDLPDSLDEARRYLKEELGRS